MKELMNNIFSQYRVTGYFLGFKYPVNGFKHGIGMLAINLTSQVLNAYKHASVTDGKVTIEGSDTMLTIIDVVSFVLSFWLLNTAFKRYMIKRAMVLTERELINLGVPVDDNVRLELIHRGCQLYEKMDSTFKGQLSDILRIIVLALTMSLISTVIVVAII